MSERADYLGEHVREALAADPRVNELGLTVDVRGDRVFVRGTVSTEERQQAVAEVFADVAPGYELHNETSVASYSEAANVETLG